MAIDGATHLKAVRVTAVLDTTRGPIFVQSTDASGIIKTKHFLADDAIRACEKVGWEHVFVICMDGACESTLKLLEKGEFTPVDVEKMPYFRGLTAAQQKVVTWALRRILVQRCAAHAANLVAESIAAEFPEAVQWSVKIVMFLSQHNFIYAAMLRSGHHALTMAVETRYVSQVYSTEALVKAWAAIKSVLFSQATGVWVRSRNTPASKQAHAEICAFIAVDANKEMLEQFVGVMKGIRQLIRVMDSETPNLCHAKPAFDRAREVSVGEARLLGPELATKVDRIFRDRAVDCVSHAAWAAMTVVPAYGLDASKPLPADAIRHLFNLMKVYLSARDGPRTAISPACQAGMVLFFQYTKGETIFATYKPELDAVAKDPVAYWRLVHVYAGDEFKPAIDFFIRLATAYAGQGSSERQHKVVKTLRTKQRNRMSAKVTEALQLIRSTQRMEEARLAGKTTMPCLKAIRLQIAEVIEEAEEEEEEANDGAGGGGGGGGGGANGGVEGEAIAANPPPPAWNYVLEYIRAGRANDGDREGLNDLFDNEENVEDAEAALEGNGAAAAVAAAAAAGSGSGV
jgi:hypothetical protein